jgi:hypothetical protein
MHGAIRDLLQMQNQLRIFHWQTKSYAAHKALGKAYEGLDGLIDTFVETALGRTEVDLSNGNMNIMLFDDKELDVNTAMETYREFLQDISNKLNPATDTDLINIRDEMLGLINHTNYLLKLS